MKNPEGHKSWGDRGEKATRKLDPIFPIPRDLSFRYNSLPSLLISIIRHNESVGSEGVRVSSGLFVLFQAGPNIGWGKMKRRKRE